MTQESIAEAKVTTLRTSIMGARAATANKPAVGKFPGRTVV